MYVIILSLLEQASIRALAVDHPASHRDGSGHNVVQQVVVPGIAHRVDASLREGQVDGLGEVERSG